MSLRLFVKGFLGYIAYYLVYPSFLIAWIHKIRGVKFTNYRSVYIASNVIIDSLYPEEIQIGDRVFITRHCIILSHFNPTKPLRVLMKKQLNNSMSIIKNVVIGPGTFIGVGSIILPGVSLGSCCIVGAGSVVTKSFPDRSVIGGNPAILIRTIEEDEAGTNA